MKRTALVLAATALLCAACGEGGDSGQIGVANNGGADAGDTGGEADGSGDGGDASDIDPRCEGLADPTTLEMGEPTECGGFDGPCALKGTQMRTDTVCRGGQVIEAEVAVACDRETDGLVIEGDEFSECAGFEGECGRSGLQTRPVTVCRLGELTEEVEEMECERDTDGVQLEQGDAGECAFADDCVETGVALRTDRICMDGEAVDAEIEVSCGRETEGVELARELVGECAYDDECDEAGAQEIALSVCRAGAATDETLTEDCTRDTDGVVTQTGEFDDCAYDTVCSEVGARSRTDEVCADGLAVPTVVTEVCNRETDELVAVQGEFGACGEFDSECDQTGERLRTDTVCVDGQGVLVDVTEGCSRDTDGIVTAVGEFGACGEFADVCDEDGRWTRTDTVCMDGEPVPTEVTEECTRDTDGVVVSTGEPGDCGGFEGVCGEDGTSVRVDVVCQDGTEVDSPQSTACSRDTDGVVVQVGTFEDCAYADACIEEGARSRVDIVCDGGVETDVVESEDCTRDTDGVILDEVISPCTGFDDACDETGLQTRTNGVCRAGVPETEVVTEACERDTDGTVAEVGPFGDCGGFEGRCGEQGTQVRTDIVCVDGQGTPQAVQQSCTRDTEGDTVGVGEEGACGGFDGTCDESGEAPRIDRVCRDGDEVDEQVMVLCTRDTDGQVVDPGIFGQCGRFDDACDESGLEARVEIRCVNGGQSPFEITRDCARETDGIIVSEGELGECGGFGDQCDETGFTQRTDVVCEDGEMVDVLRESVACSRDTDGIVVDPGEFGDCGGFQSPCATDGTRRRDVFVCRNGGTALEPEIEACQRETEGLVIEAGEFGDCIGFDDECDETGVYRRNNLVCAGGQQVHVLDEADCSRIPEDCADVCVFDALEPNDDVEDATVTVDEVGGVDLRNLTMCTGDEDWFALAVPNGADSVQVRVVQFPATPALPIELFDSNDQLVASNSDAGSERTLTAEGLGAGDYSVRITADVGDAGVDYDFSLAVYDAGGCLPDYHEPNDDYDSPSFLARGRTQSALCAGELDHFAFHADAYSTFDIALRFEHNGQDDPFTYLYSPDGDLHDFFNPDFEDPDVEYLGQGEVRVTPSSAGDWVVLMDGAFTARNFEYEFDLDYQEPMCPDAPDAFEPNETCATGAQLPLDLDNCEPGTPNCSCRIDQTCDAPLSCVNSQCQTGHVCGPVSDQDYYLVEVASDQQLRVRVEHFHFQGNLELEVFEPDWQTLGGFSYEAGPDFEEVVINPTASGPYCIRVFGRGGITANSYRIETFVTDQ